MRFKISPRWVMSVRVPSWSFVTLRTSGPGGKMGDIYIAETIMSWCHENKYKVEDYIVKLKSFTKVQLGAKIVIEC